jgi:hypothetical protein
MAIGWPDGKPKANACGGSKAGRPFTQPIHVVVRVGSSTANLPPSCVSMFFDHPISSFVGRLIGLNELHSTMDDVEVMMGQRPGECRVWPVTQCIVLLGKPKPADWIFGAEEDGPWLTRRGRRYL